MVVGFWFCFVFKKEKKNKVTYLMVMLSSFSLKNYPYQILTVLLAIVSQLFFMSMKWFCVQIGQGFPSNYLIFLMIAANQFAILLFP